MSDKSVRFSQRDRSTDWSRRHAATCFTPISVIFELSLISKKTRFDACSPSAINNTSVMEDMTNTVQQQEVVNKKPWRCKICTKSNKHDCLKCIICGREKTADPIKTRAFIKVVPKHSVADRKGKAVLNAMSSSNDVGSYYSERKYIRQIPASDRSKKSADANNKKGRTKNGKKPPATWGGRHSASLTSLPEHGVKSVGIGRPIGHL